MQHVRARHTATEAEYLAAKGGGRDAEEVATGPVSAELNRLADAMRKLGDSSELAREGIEGLGARLNYERSARRRKVMAWSVLVLLLLGAIFAATSARGGEPLTFTEHILAGNASSPTGPGNYFQTIEPYAKEWSEIYDHGEGVGSRLRLTGLEGSENDGCYTIGAMIYQEDIDRWLVLIVEPIPFWTQFYYEVEFQWQPAEIFADGFESGDSGAWSGVVNRSSF